MKHPEDNKTMDILDATTDKRGRPTGAAAEPVQNTFSADTAAAASQAATELALRESEIDDRFGDGLPYQRERVIHEAQFFMAQSAEAMLEAGKRLIQIKEHESHGEFIEIVEGKLGLGRRTAQQMMAAALKYLSPRLASKAQSVSLLGRSKLFDLMAESDEDIEALADGGTLAGHTLEEFESMTRREMQAALRDAKQQLEAKDKVLQDRNQKLQETEEKLHRPFKAAKGALARTAEQQSQLDELRTAITGADLAFARVSVAVATVVEQSDSEAITKAANDGLAYLIARIRDLTNAHQLMLDTSDEAFGLKPNWM
jgi:hypothetical protein